MTERDERFFKAKREDGRIDPLLTPVQLSLAAIPGCTAVFTKASNGVVGWLYDPANRIFTPCLTARSGPHAVAEAAVDLVTMLLHGHDSDDPEIARMLRVAVEIAEIEAMEYKARACEKGGWGTQDPEQIAPGGRISGDTTEARRLRERIADRRRALGSTPASGS